MSQCPSCKRFELILISGTYGHVFTIEKQYYVCQCCGDKFTREVIDNVIKKCKR